MSTTVLIAGTRGAAGELRAAGGKVEVIGPVRSLDDAEKAMRTLRPSVLVLDADLTDHKGICSLPALRRASPETAIVLPPAGEPGPRLVRAIRMAARDFEQRCRDNGLTARERDAVCLVALGHSNSRADLVRWALAHGVLAL